MCHLRRKSGCSHRQCGSFCPRSNVGESPWYTFKVIIVHVRTTLPVYATTCVTCGGLRYPPCVLLSSPAPIARRDGDASKPMAISSPELLRTLRVSFAVSSQPPGMCSFLRVDDATKQASACYIHAGQCTFHSDRYRDRQTENDPPKAGRLGTLPDPRDV